MSINLIKSYCPYRQKSWKNGKTFDSCNKNNNGYGSNADPCIVKDSCDLGEN